MSNETSLPTNVGSKDSVRPASEAEVRATWDKACRAVTVQGGGNDVQVFADYLQRPLIAEIERLRAALANANKQAERFERGWYLRGDALEKLEQWAQAYPLKVFPEPLREEWQRAAALLSEKGLSLDRMSASNMRHVINGVRETVAEGLKA